MNNRQKVAAWCDLCEGGDCSGRGLRTGNPDLAERIPITMRRIRLCMLVLPLALVACTPADSGSLDGGYNPQDPSTWPLAELVGQALDDARREGASEAQIATLESARDDGGITASEARNAAELVRQCLIDSGQQPSPLSSRNTLGVELFTFTVTAPPSMTIEVADAFYNDCERQHRQFIDYVYLQQPAAREALVRELEMHDAALRACLVEMGGRDIEGLTTGELWEELKHQSFGGEAAGYSQEVDCLMSVGIYW